MVMIKNIGEKNSLLNYFISEIRDKDIQRDSMRFRKNLERIGEVFAYEISKNLEYSEKTVQTPLGISNMLIPAEKIVLATILRAGLPLHQGMLNYFDKSENAFISAFRKYHKDGSFDIQFEYLSSPDLEDKVVILSDPMLATGASIVVAYNGLIERGLPKHTHIVSIIASKEGLEYVEKMLSNHNITIWIAAIDDELTAKAYIVPGLGDAGDLAYGDKC